MFEGEWEWVLGVGDIRVGGRGGVWVWRRRLLALEKEKVRECADLLLNTVLQEHIQDKWK